MSLINTIIDDVVMTFNFGSMAGTFGFYSSESTRLYYSEKANEFVECLGIYIYGSQSMIAVYQAF